MRIAFFGDSFVNGFGDPLYQGWVGRICASARTRGEDVTAYNCGIRRATSKDVRAIWHAEAGVRLPPEFKCGVVFSFGANDQRIEQGAPRVSTEQQIDNTRAILSAAQRQWPVLFIASPRSRDETDETFARTRAIKELCDSLGVPFLDTCAASADFKQWHGEAKAGDGVHPGAAGYAEFAAVVEAWPAWHKLLDKLKG